MAEQFPRVEGKPPEESEPRFPRMEGILQKKKGFFAWDTSFYVVCFPRIFHFVSFCFLLGFGVCFLFLFSRIFNLFFFLLYLFGVSLFAFQHFD